MPRIPLDEIKRDLEKIDVLVQNAIDITDAAQVNILADEDARAEVTRNLRDVIANAHLTLLSL